MPDPLDRHHPRSRSSRGTSWRLGRWLLATTLIFALGAALGLGAGLWVGEQERAERQAKVGTVSVPPPSLPLLDEVPRATLPRFDTEDEMIAGLLQERFLREDHPETDRAQANAAQPALGQPPLRAPRVPPGNHARIAIVIDDLGLNRPKARETVALPGPLTLAFMTYAERIDSLIEEARARGHEIIVHVPMEPLSESTDPGPKALLLEQGGAEIRANLAWALSRFGGYVGINNHMGSRFTADEAGMRVVMEELKARDLWFLDSRTSPESKAEAAARRYGVPLAVRDVFLDNDRAVEMIHQQLLRTETAALGRGYAIAIGHPYPETLQVLAEWLPTLEDRGFELVPVSELLHRPAATAQARQLRKEVPADPPTPLRDPS